MIKDIDMLIALCHKELVDRGYCKAITRYNDNYWKDLAQWMQEQSIEEFDRQVAERYCQEVLKISVFPLGSPGCKGAAVMKARAVRKLVTFQEFGDFCRGAPRKPKPLTGSLAGYAQQFIDHCGAVMGRKALTLTSKKSMLHDFCDYADRNALNLDNLAYRPLMDFIADGDPAISTKQRRSILLRQFLRFLYDNGKTDKDLSMLIPTVKSPDTPPISSIYTDKEINSILDSVERGSAKGKRDYVALLLFCELGLRSSDVRSLKLDDIDWDAEVIRLRQKKTGEPLELPMSGRLGNAILAYLQHARPNKKTKARELLLQLDSAGEGKPISGHSLHKTVTEAMACAKIKIAGRRHGPHAMRHSLATRMVGEKIAMPVIGAVLGHKSSESTKKYLAVAVSQLKQCALPMPALKSKYYLEDEP